MTGLFRPGTSLVHRAPAGLKLLLLVLLGLGLIWVREPATVAAALGVVVLLYGLAGFGPKVLLTQVRPVVWVLLAIGLVHVLVDGWVAAAVTVGDLLALVLLAGLVTLTTRTTALVDVVVRLLHPVRRWVDPERVGLLLALAVRSVPVVAELAREVREAQHARGLAASPRAFAVPLVVRSLRHADALGEALAARGADD